MEKLTEAQLHEMADLISEVVVIRDMDNDGNTRDYSRPTFDVEADIISKVAYSALWSQNRNLEDSSLAQRQALKDMAEAMINELLPNCNAFSTIYVPLDIAFMQWQRFLELNPSLGKEQLDDRKMFEDSLLEKWANIIGEFITVREGDMLNKRFATPDEAKAISEVALFALKVLNSCNKLDEFLQAKVPVMRNAKDKIERILPYCRGQNTIYEPLDELLGHFERKFREPQKAKNDMERD